MNLLVTGIVIWSVVHLFPSVAPTARQALFARFGNGYRGSFALLVLSALILIVLGWQSAVPSAIYAPPLVGSPVIPVLMLIAFVLFFAARTPTNIKRFLRHPQLTSVVLWAAAHLLANGDSRSLALFGSFGVWALLDMGMINRRDGAWQKPTAVPLTSDALTVVIGIAAFAIILYFHQWLFGVQPITG